MKPKYPEITNEQKQAIKDLFEDSYSLEIAFETRKDGYHINLQNMYGYIRFNEGISVLRGYGEIANILQVSDGDELDRYHYDGCETCDYGSSFNISLKFW